MLVLSTINEVRAWHAGKIPARIVLVPTMGALHEGHLKLVHEARQIAGPEGSVVVSIFVNPTQFGPNEDFSKYPRELQADAEKCEAAGVDMIFAPDANEVYPPDRSMQVLETSLSTTLCGASRPGHFDGVCLVVLKLFNIIQPTHSVFGKKDYQQLAIIRRMTRDLDVPVEIIGIETVREPDGLALSSRNRYLNQDERDQAVEIRRGLEFVNERFLSGETDSNMLTAMFEKHLAYAAPLHRLDYIACVNRDTLIPDPCANDRSLLATAVFFGKTRLIDNLELGI
ncbi:pantoate--beta-alanine ligase [Phragmitibacter flavus]|uniref:Pantothenate synthetase n=1 Tax=Phragmitibacter flavus TaxID=2576071 RepID=A0A5R8K8F9_9BACT|nr:pantoate--beta-alanine ligase [Phragmitibacter flavus]TLD68634.1 pantoate--beta-alanine ligase [Phragmitibacter flavus]